MFFTYVVRELRRRHRQALLSAMGLAVGVALVVAVTAYAAGVGKAQDQVLQSLYGVGTDITVSQQQKMEQGGPQRFGMQPPDESKQGEKFSRSRVMTSPGQQSISTKRLTQIASLDGVSAVTGSLSMSVMNVQGEFAQVQGGASGSQPTANAQQSGDGSSSQHGQAQMSPIDVSSLSVSGVDTGDLDLGPLSAAQIASGRALTSADANAEVMVVTKAYAEQNSLKVGDTKKIDGKEFTVVGIVALPAGSTSSDVYIPLSWAQKLSDNASKAPRAGERAGRHRPDHRRG